MNKQNVVYTHMQWTIILQLKGYTIIWMNLENLLSEKKARKLDTKENIP